MIEKSQNHLGARNRQSKCKIEKFQVCKWKQQSWKEKKKRKPVERIFSNILGRPGMNYLESQDHSKSLNVDQVLSKPTTWSASGTKGIV